jgi:hypothetical protein
MPWFCITMNTTCPICKIEIPFASQYCGVFMCDNYLYVEAVKNRDKDPHARNEKKSVLYEFLQVDKDTEKTIDKVDALCKKNNLTMAISKTHPTNNK